MSRSAHPTAMNNSPTRPRPRQAQAPRDYDDGQPAIYHNSAKPAPSSARFDSHDDFYDFLDSNRGGPMPALNSLAGPSNANANVSASLHTQPLQMPQQQQRFGQNSGPSNQSPSTSRPPLTNSFPPQASGAPDRSRPPSYSGSSRSEEMLVADRTRDDGRIQRQNGRRGPPDGKPVSGPRPRPPTSSSAGSSPPRNSTSYPINPQVQHAQAQSKAASASDPSLSIPGASVGASIQRLKSPSVADCVLQPLDQKVREYNELMNREQDEMDRLDAELRALQERRADAETRFLEAKGKHDDYKQQYVNVERAMRGEAALPPPTPREQPAPLARQHTRPMSLQDDDDDDDDDDLALPPSSHRRINSQQSFGRSSQKL
ncbi:uncharacterized protein GGS22DRAFT_161700, partial [Annulohypoxylon maeteangense]|uniref:uncharacterized protein n=1 Tax=Annulohypoxylon maeteangense TaxID=1927788 RepID=UPI002007DFAC